MNWLTLNLVVSNPVWYVRAWVHFFLLYSVNLKVLFVSLSLVCDLCEIKTSEKYYLAMNICLVLAVRFEHICAQLDANRTQLYCKDVQNCIKKKSAVLRIR